VKIFSWERAVHFICPCAVETLEDAAYSDSITASLSHSEYWSFHTKMLHRLHTYLTILRLIELEVAIRASYTLVWIEYSSAPRSIIRSDISDTSHGSCTEHGVLALPGGNWACAMTSCEADFKPGLLVHTTQIRNSPMSCSILG
jgi:hypothetical protein